MKDINTTLKIVEAVLEKNSNARNSDNELYLCVCKSMVSNIGNLPFGYVIKHQKELGIPKFETVRRSRQKLQANNPDLQANDEVTEARYENWKVVRKFAVE